jgi:hypothetical protein
MRCDIIWLGYITWNLKINKKPITKLKSKSKIWYDILIYMDPIYLHGSNLILKKYQLH